ncbi:MAG: NAD(P)/FAD-dependent oxidoreductase [Candidatus Izemoplasmatales bacterium]
MIDCIVIGGGAGGLAAAIEIKRLGHNVLLIEREDKLGGILNQCIHNGFGLEIFKEEYTGPEYADKYIKLFLREKINYLIDTTVIDLYKEEDIFIVKTSSETLGIREYKSKSICLSTGSYERTRGQISIPGDRPYGVITAGSAQRYINIDGYMTGKRVFILGSGDIGLIMARRMTLEGAKVLGVAEIMPYSNGLNRNIVQCLNDFDIPLYLSHTVTNIKADDSNHLKEIRVMKVDDSFNVIKDTEIDFQVDTLLLSVGLIPDIILLDQLDVEIDPLTKSVKVDQSNQTSIEGLFVCGNALQIHDLVDNVSKESQRTGKAIDLYLRNTNHSNKKISFIPGVNIAYLTPQYIDFSNPNEKVVVSFRPKKKIEKSLLKVIQNDRIVYEKKKMFLLPAEMETIELDILHFDENQPITLELEVISW